MEGNKHVFKKITVLRGLEVIARIIAYIRSHELHIFIRSKSIYFKLIIAIINLHRCTNV